ncbi:SRPBCC domain-containing protein [Acinetobacter bereziniae]|uniref:SRPBCC domain-containing protein n=1 Tax=Acinetobacter bereziniae TaxID=106648 RepID=UPI002952FD97|nr:SRPBCC domain-containing protein [Acinetobacter bereziniae]MDV8158057.1 SRPBCC domain-containing protein [Acinetobacter bereziniae]
MLSLKITTHIYIHATPEQVWQVLTDFKSYESWNSFIRKVEGKLNIGEKLKIRIHPTKQKAMEFKPTLLGVKNAQSLSWLGHFLILGLLDGEHHFKLCSQEDGSTCLVHSETFSGLLVPMMRNNLKSIRKDFEYMNQFLKLFVESKL